MKAKEIKIPLYPDHSLTAKHWENPKGIPTLAMHGWLDNAGSFDFIAPYLEHYDLVALDFPGHGHSTHKPTSSFFHILDLVVESFLVVNHLGWDTFAVLGHSLGAVVGSLVAGTFPTRIHHLVLIDALGAQTKPPEQTPHQLQNYLQMLLNKKPSSPNLFPSLDLAIQARMKATPMHYESAKRIVERGTKKIKGGFIWSTDPKLLRPTPIQLTEEQNNAFLEDIKAPALLIRPEPGFPFDPTMIERRISKVEHLHFKTLPGNHHAHLDKPKEVASLINKFVKQIL